MTLGLSRMEKVNVWTPDLVGKGSFNIDSFISGISLAGNTSALAKFQSVVLPWLSKVNVYGILVGCTLIPEEQSQLIREIILVNFSQHLNFDIGLDLLFRVKILRWDCNIQISHYPNGVLSSIPARLALLYWSIPEQSDCVGLTRT